MIIDIATPNSPSSQPLIRGRWHNLRWSPNESTGELLNIGVVLTSADGIPHVKVIEAFDRVKCLYDAHVAADAKFLVGVVRDAVLAGADMPSNSICLSEPKFASGESIASVLDQLFRATVPLGAPKMGERLTQDEIRAANTTSVRKEVLDALRQIAGMRADRIITTEKTLQVVEEGKAHHLDIPLQTHNALGTIVSARYAQIKDSELNILRADSDLQIARKLYRQDRLLMYVVRHEQEANAERTDQLLAEFSWKFKKVGIDMKSYTHPELVAHDILEDMPVSMG